MNLVMFFYQIVAFAIEEKQFRLNIFIFKFQFQLQNIYVLCKEAAMNLHQGLGV